MINIRKYTINAGNETDYVSTNIIDSKLCVVTYQSDNVFCSKIIKLKSDETSFRSSHIHSSNKKLILLIFYNSDKSSTCNDFNCYFDTLL